MQITIRLSELLAARLCHELVNPVGATNNGLELLNEKARGMGGEALDLAVASAREASGLLRYYRLAYGTAGERGSETWANFADIAEGALGGDRVTFNWPESSEVESLSPKMIKLLLNVLLIAREALMRGGSISVDVVDEGPECSIAVLVAGTSAAVPAEIQRPLTEDVPEDELDARSVQGAFTRLMAEQLGGSVAVDDNQEGCVIITVTVPSGS